MFRFVIFISLLAISYAGRQAEDRIVGGESININQAPYQLSFQKNGGHFCGATLINSRTAVSAAHCCINQIVSRLSVRAKSDMWSSGGQVVKVKKFINHPNYNTKTLDSDICILQLESPIYTTYAKLPPTNNDPPNGVSAFISGWGHLRENGFSIPAKLQGTTVKVVDRATCNRSYSNSITLNKICAANPGKDTCQGDSGGPFVINNCLIGVVSYGIGCARATHPGVYTNVAKFTSWIKANTI